MQQRNIADFSDIELVLFLRQATGEAEIIKNNLTVVNAEIDRRAKLAQEAAQAEAPKQEAKVIPFIPDIPAQNV